MYIVSTVENPTLCKAGQPCVSWQSLEFLFQPQELRTLSAPWKDNSWLTEAKDGLNTTLTAYKHRSLPSDELFFIEYETRAS